MAIELKRAREGVAILTLQYEVRGDLIEALLDEEAESILNTLIEEGMDGNEVVAFIDRPQRGPVVTDLNDGGRESAGPAELRFPEPELAVVQAPAEVAQPAGNRDRFDGKPWFEEPPRADRDNRFIVEVK